MRHFDTFTGYGGFTLAADKLGIQTVGASEIDPYANAVYAFNNPHVENYGDIKNWREWDLPDFDLLTGGFPCQDLSVAGPRDGLGGSRSGLFYSWLEILYEKSPSYFILENVKGLYSSTKGWDYGRLLYEVASLGYHVQWGTVNSRCFVPQNRERVFIVGCLGEEPRASIFPIEEANGEVPEIGREISYCLDANYWKGPSPSGFQSCKRQLVYEDERLRKLTPLECERLMGLPDYYTKLGWNDRIIEISNTQRYKMLGNGIVPAVVAEILRRLILNAEQERP